MSRQADDSIHHSGKPCQLLGMALILSSMPLPAADPQPYTVTFDKTGDTKLDQALQDTSTLSNLNI